MSESAAAQKRHGPLKVLVVDDSSTFRRELRARLELEVLEVVGEARNGQEAVELSAQLQPDVVLMDQNMPTMSGIDATRQIKRSRPNTRVIFVAAEGAWREEALTAGAEAYFVKDNELEALLRLIKDPFGSLRRGVPPEVGPTKPSLLSAFLRAVRAPIAGFRARPKLQAERPRHSPGGPIWRVLAGLAGVGILAAILAFHSTLLPGMALALGVGFFMYGLKYYSNIALILLASGRSNGNGNGNSHGNGRGLFNGNGHGKRNGLRNGKRNGNGNALGLTNGGNGRLHRQPFISIHLPLYNETQVVDRLLTACTSLDYDNYEVIVADDSIDKTTEILRQRWESHPKVKISHRADRSGFKGGALQVALERTDPRAEFISVFDADFLPPPDILHQFLAYFYGSNGLNGNGHHDRGDGEAELRLIDDRVAVVQGYQWHILNASENWITKGIRSEYSGSYVVQRSGQELLGLMKMIAGSVFMIRADVLREHGWGTSITEDWELTLRLYLKGYKVLYTPFIQAPAECVSGFKQLTRQRMRWAEGHTFNVKKFFQRMMSSRNLSLLEKLEFIYYAPYYLQSVFFILGTGAWLISELFLDLALPFWTEALGWSLILVNTFSLVLVNLTGLFLERGVRRNWIGLGSFILLSFLLVPYQAYAALKGLIEPHEGGWHRTQKTGVITEMVDKLGLGRRMRRLLPKKKRRAIDLEKRFGPAAARLWRRTPRSLRNIIGRAGFGLRFGFGLATGGLTLAILFGSRSTGSVGLAAFLFTVVLVPFLVSVVWRRRRLAWRLMSLLLSVSIALGLLASQVTPVSAAPDSFYLRRTTFEDVNFEQLETGSSTGSDSVVTSVALTSAANHLYLAAVSTNLDVAVSSVAGLGLTWTLVKAQCGARGQTRTEVWKALGSPTGGEVVTATLASTPSAAVIAVSRYSGVNTTSPVGNSVSANTLGTDGACTGGTDTGTYTVSLTTTHFNSVAYGAVSLSDRTHTPGNGYTEQAEINASLAGVAVEDKLQDTQQAVGVNGTLSDLTDWAVVGVEIKAGSHIMTPGVQGSGGGEKVLINSTPQVITWYSTDSYPSGGEDASIPSGAYDFIMEYRKGAGLTVTFTAQVGLSDPDGSNYSQFGESASFTTQDAPGDLTDTVNICSSCPAQTITAANPKRLVFRINVTSVAGGGIDLKYDAATGNHGDDTRLETPVVTVPEYAIGFVAAAVLIPTVAGGLWRKRRSRDRVKAMRSF